MSTLFTCCLDQTTICDRNRVESKRIITILVILKKLISFLCGPCVESCAPNMFSLLTVKESVSLFQTEISTDQFCHLLH